MGEGFGAGCKTQMEGTVECLLCNAMQIESTVLEGDEDVCPRCRASVRAHTSRSVSASAPTATGGIAWTVSSATNTTTARTVAPSASAQ